jgi:hypothetical protein
MRIRLGIYLLWHTGPTDVPGFLVLKILRIVKIELP